MTVSAPALTKATAGSALVDCRCCAAIAVAQREIGLPRGAATRWGLPLVAGIGAGHDRFNALSRLLAPATPRALSQGLMALGKHGLVSREVLDLRPPASRYELTRTGRVLAEACTW